MTYSPFGLGITTLGTSQASKFVSVDSNGDLVIPDSDKFKFGTGSDMQVYHDGSHGYLTNATGTLKLATETSGIAISIGHTTSEVTVNDNLTVTGDLTVNGTTTTINSTTLTVDDLNIVLASGAADSAAADGAGITIDGASASLIYDHTGTQWEFNKNVEFAGKLLPNADSTYDLGSTSLGWNDLHMGSGGVINFSNGDVTLTHSSNTITVAGGTLATAALTATTGTFSGVLKTDDTTDDDNLSWSTFGSTGKFTSSGQTVSANISTLTNFDRIRFKIVFTTDDTGVSPRINALVFHAAWNPIDYRKWTAVVKVSDKRSMLLRRVRSNQVKTSVMSDLDTLRQEPFVLLQDPDGTTHYVNLRYTDSMISSRVYSTRNVAPDQSRLLTMEMTEVKTS